MRREAEIFLETLLSGANAAVLTGAGISTESGIPDYRSPREGLWEKMDQSVVSLDGFMENPCAYYSYALELYPVRRAAKPNAGHFLFAELERRKAVGGIITQNVDGLHREAGSENVCELHGSIRETVCLECEHSVPMDDVMQRVIKGESVPLCECGGVLKPDAVFFGEPLPEEPWDNAVKLAGQADVLVVAGSSLQVAPASAIPQIALSKGAKLIIINLTQTPCDDKASFVVRRKIAEFSQEVAGLLKRSRITDGCVQP